MEFFEERPKKKRRFFVDGPADPADPHTIAISANTSSRPTSVTSISSTEQRSSQTDAGDVKSFAPGGNPSFDADTFRAVVGEDVGLATIEAIRLAANGDLERAINMYFDGSWKKKLHLRLQQSHYLQDALAHGSVQRQKLTPSHLPNHPSVTMRHPLRETYSIRCLPTGM